MESTNAKLDVIARQLVKDREHREACHKEMKDSADDGIRATQESLLQILHQLKAGATSIRSGSEEVIGVEQGKKLCQVC